MFHIQHQNHPKPRRMVQTKTFGFIEAETFDKTLRCSLGLCGLARPSSSSRPMKHCYFALYRILESAFSAVSSGKKTMVLSIS